MHVIARSSDQAIVLCQPLTNLSESYIHTTRMDTCGPSPTLHV